MEYNSYYPAQTGPPPPGPPSMMNHQHDCPPMGGHMMPVGGPPSSMMHSNQNQLPPPPNMRQTPGSLSMQQQQPQHQGLHMQTMPPQQQPSPHPNYHQLPHTPLSHSASPHPSTTPLQQPSRPSTGPSPMHHQSPVHMNGPSPKVHPMMSASQQHMNHLPGPQNSGPQLLPPNVNQQQPPPPQMQHTHNQNFINEPPMHPNPNSHYNQQPPPMNQHHGPIPQMHHGPPPLPPPHNHQAGPPQPTYISHMHPAIERSSPFYQHIPQTEFRIIELNKRLQNRPRPKGPASPLPIIGTLDESGWWEKFACDFFDDDATLTLRVPGEDKPTEYTIGRTLVPRFFRSYFEGGVIDLTLKLRNTRETGHHLNSVITLDCDHTDITTKNLFKHPATNMIMNVVVHTEGHLSLDFISNSFDNLLIKSWRFYTHQCHEYIDRSMTTTGLPHTYLVEPVTRYGLTKSTVAYLKMCMIMEPMQDLMLQHRQTKMDPRSCLKKLLFDKYKLKSVDDDRAQPNKRRKRKTPAVSGGGNTKKNKANNANNNLNNPNAIGNNNIGMNNNNGSLTTNSDSGMVNLPLTSQDVLVVGEPSMLGADFGDENERRITRLENNQFDSSLVNGTHSNNKNQLNQQGQSEISNDLGQNPNQQQQQQSNMHHANNNNHDGVRTGIQSMLNHNNGGSNNNNNNANDNSSANNNNNSMMNSDHNLSNNNNNCLQNSNNPGTNNNNGNNHQMNLMLNGTNTNNVNHIAKSEIELKQQIMSTGAPTFATESEAR